MDRQTGRWSWVFAVLASLCVAACNTVAPNRLSLADTAQLRFTGIEVQTEGATVNWTEGEDEYLRSRNLSLTDSTVVRTPEARAFIRDRAGQRVKAALERALAARIEGTRPARLVISLIAADVPSPARRIITGGGPVVIRADIAIVDARTGAVLSLYSGDTGSSPGSGGLIGVVADAALTPAIGDLFDRAANDFARRFRTWLAAGT